MPVRRVAKNRIRLIIVTVKIKQTQIFEVQTDRRTPLSIACQLGLFFRKSLSLLLQYNADLNVTYKDDFLPLHIVCQHGHDECITLLEQYNADLNVASIKYVYHYYCCLMQITQV